MNREFSLFRFIFAGIRQKPGRNLATAFCFAFIAANIFSAQYLVAGTGGTISQGTSRMGADLLVIPSPYVQLVRGAQMGPVTAGSIIRVEPSSLRINISDMDRISRVTGVGAISPQLFVASLTVPALSLSPVDIYGIDPVTDFTVRPWLANPLKTTLGHGEIIVGNALVGGISSPVKIGGNSYTIAGRLDPTNSGVDRTVFMTLGDAYALAAEPGILPASTPPVGPDMVNAVLVGVEPGADPGLVASLIQQPFPYSYLRILEKHVALKSASQAVQGLPGIMNFISVVVILAALPLIGLIAAMVAHERQREIGLLLSMGASRVLVFFLVMAESLVLAVAGGLAGVSAGLGIFFLLNTMGRVPFLQGFQVPPAAGTAMMAAIAIGIVVLVGSIASLWPAYRSSRMNPYDAIRAEE
jgi:putative ABC transport system permease protein